MNLQEPLKELYRRSQLLVLDFSQIPAGTPADESIQHYFETAEHNGNNPRLPENRQKFNDYLLDKSGARYICSRYGEDRQSMLVGSSIAREGRTIHLGIDIFCKTLETVYAPCNGMIKQIGREPEDHSFGHYIILEPENSLGTYIFFGHLSASRLPSEGTQVTAGQAIASIGDFSNGENGGWSRHLHLQILKELPPEGQAPIGYSSKKDFPRNRKFFPDPMDYFSEWHLQ